MSFTDLDLDNFLTVKNKIIDLNRAVLINSGNAVNPNDIPTKQYTDDALNKAIATVNIKFNEQKLRIDALTCSLKDAGDGNKDAGEGNKDEGDGNKDAGEGNKDAGDGNTGNGNKDTSLIIKKLNDEIFRAQQVEDALLANYDALKRQVDKIHFNTNLITQLKQAEEILTAIKQAEETITAKCDLLQQQLNHTNVITQLKQVEETLTAKCDFLQQQLNQLHYYFFGTDDASTPPLR